MIDKGPFPWFIVTLALFMLVVATSPLWLEPMLRQIYLQQNPLCEEYYDMGYDSLETCEEIKQAIDNSCAGFEVESYLIQKYDYLGCDKK